MTVADFSGAANPINVTRYHSLTVEPKILPDCLHVAATTADGMIMGLAHKQHPVYGVQFHPESIASEMGHEMLANFLSCRFQNQQPPAGKRTKAA